MEGEDTTGWHRKWVLLACFLGWLFLYRYRVMGWLLSKAITYHLSKSHSKLSPVAVQVERVSLQPLRFFNVELSSSGSTCWRVVLTKVEVQSHVKEFFESFGLVKICILVIDEVVGDVREVDAKVLTEVLLPKKMAAKSAVPTRSKMNPICYMRFVDLRVESIRLRVNCLEMTSQFICQKLYAGITDVFVQREMLQLKVQAKSLMVSICPQFEGDPALDGSDGVRLEIPDSSVVLDLHLRTQRFLGCKMFGCEEQMTSIVVSTAFVERMLLIRNELILKGLAAAGTLKTGISRPGESSGVAPLPVVSSSDIEISGFQLSVTIVENVDTFGSVPLQFCADVRKITYLRQLVPSLESSTEILPSDVETTCSTGSNHNAFRVHVEGLVQNVQVCNTASGAKLLSVCSVEMRSKQTTKTRGVVTGTFEKVNFFLSHRSEKIVRSLVATQERVETCQGEAKRMITSAFTKRPSASTTDRLDQEKENRIHWDAELEITSWMLAFKALAKDGGLHDFTASGTATSIQTPLAPMLSDNGSSNIKRSVLIQHINVDMIPNGLSAHSAAFGGAKMIFVTSLDPRQNSKTVGISVKFEFVSINGLLPEDSGDPYRFPALYLHDVKIDREEKISVEATEIDMDICFEHTNVKWDYREHNTFLVEWAAITSVINQLDQLVSSTSSKKKRLPGNFKFQESQPEQVPLKIIGTSVYSKDTTIDVIDIPDVAPLATFCLVNTRVNHRATQLSATTALNCANAMLRWGESDETFSTIELTDASFQNRSSLGRQRYLTKVPIQSDIRCNTLKTHLRPRSRLLLLFLRLDQLTSGSSEKVDSVKRSSVQGISFSCGAFIIELEGIQASPNVSIIKLATLGIKMTRSSPREITEAMNRLANCLGKENFGGRTFSEVADKVMTMDGTASAGAISAAIPSKEMVELRDTELHFAISDVEWSRLLSWDQPSQQGSVVTRTLGFDLSILTERMQLAMERKPFDALLRLVPILQEAFDTKTGEKPNTVSDSCSFRLRYAGNFDIAFHEAELSCPYGDKEGRDQIGNKVTRVLVSEVALNLRQFQVLHFKCAPLRVLLDDAASSDNAKVGLGIGRGVDSLQLLFIPEVSVHSVIHWKHGIHYSGQLQYALSLEIAIGNMHPHDEPAQVPLADEALVAINWDCVYPWLICMATDDDDGYQPDNSTRQNQRDVDTRNRIQCVGVQWDLSVSLMQIAWWDTATQEIGMLIVLNEFLTHGVFRTDTSSSSLDLELNGRQWKLWEATVYLHLFRGYLLHIEDDFASAELLMPDVLPFGSEMVSNFSVETVGTTYRDTYTPEENEDWDVLDDQVTATFAPSNATMFDRLHDNFVVIDYEFAVVGHQKVPSKQETTVGKLPLLHVPVSVRTFSSAISPPKSPRSAKNWTQNIRNRLSRMKRRSVSMDNLLLKDGSCPIQVDSMRLLWTIQTRDSIFYMVATTLDSLQLLLDARKNSSSVEQQSGVPNAGPYSPRRAKRNSFRPPSFASTSESNDSIPEPPHFSNRRASTRDTLLDLLQQGKLGMTLDNDRESSSKSLDEDTNSSRGSISEDTTDHDAPKTIAMKAYTVDIHDVQINVREETTRSNMLLASKHIHFEIGTDAGESTTIANLTFDNVTAHVAPIDVDISAGVLWYSHSDAGPSNPGSTLLKQIMDECSLTSTYRNISATGATSTEVDLSFLQLSTDRHQFYQLINVIRHVLLAPPSAARRAKRANTPSRTHSTEAPSPQQDGNDIMVFVPPSPTSTNMLSGSTKKLHVLLEEELRNREVRTRGTAARSKATALKAISFKVVGLQWRLRLSPEVTGADHEFVGIRIQGFTGCHTYFTNHCTKLTLNLQWLEVSNLHPGASSASFEDPTAVLKAKLLVDKRFESSSGNQKGMLVVRAESGPIVRVHGQKLRVLEVLEVSMFPEVSNMIVIQLTADFYELIYKFFFENVSPTPASSQNSEQVFFGRKSTYGPASPPGSSSNVISSQRGSISPFTKSRVPPTSPPPAQGSLRPLRKTSSAGMIADSNSTSVSGGGQNSPTAASSSEELSVFEDSDSTADDCELFYVKYVRVGNVRLRINCNGFFVNLSHFDLDLPPYVCQSKLCTTQQLLQKFESHLKWYITKESASSGLSQFKNKLLKWTPSSPSTESKKEKSKKQEEDTAAANAQVLFGPYSGSST